MLLHSNKAQATNWKIIEGKVTMPVCMGVRNDPVFNTANRLFKHANFIIHEACIVDGKLANQIEGLNYCITFLDKFAREVDNAKQI